MCRSVIFKGYLRKWSEVNVIYQCLCSIQWNLCIMATLGPLISAKIIKWFWYIDKALFETITKCMDNRFHFKSYSCNMQRGTSPRVSSYRSWIPLYSYNVKADSRMIIYLTITATSKKLTQVVEESQGKYPIHWSLIVNAHK